MNQANQGSITLRSVEFVKNYESYQKIITVVLEDTIPDRFIQSMEVTSNSSTPNAIIRELAQGTIPNTKILQISFSIPLGSSGQWKNDFEYLYDVVIKLSDGEEVVFKIKSYYKTGNPGTKGDMMHPVKP